MKTIEERLKELRSAESIFWDNDSPMSLGFSNQATHRLADAEQSIIKPWNAAEKAMKKFISDWYWRDGEEWQCGICHASNDWHEEWHTPETCSIASHQAALAKMEETDED